MKPVIVSGIQPTGNLHLGNYLGAVKNWVDLQNSGKYQCYFFIADYHSLTGGLSAADRSEKILTLAAELLAAGIDPKKSTLFVQSQVVGHTELAWIFNTITPVAELYRMTQFKDKSAKQEKNINAGLLTYPALMAADILLYRANLIPVGIDQIQHVELTSDILHWFNNRFGTYFGEVKPLLTETPKVMSLLEPTKKMSKSHGLNSVIELADEPEVLLAKLKKAVTATEGGDAPGVQNLLLLLQKFGTAETHAQFVRAAKDGTIRYGDLKTVVGEAILTQFSQFRKLRQDYLAHPAKVQKILAAGAKVASKVAAKTTKEVRKLVGLG